MKNYILGILATCFLLSQPAIVSAADVVAEVNVSKQMMTVIKNGQILYSWKVSTGRKGYGTPGGTFKPQRMHKMWHSRKYDNAPMPKHFTVWRRKSVLKT